MAGREPRRAEILQNLKQNITKSKNTCYGLGKAILNDFEMDFEQFLPLAAQWRTESPEGLKSYKI